MIDGRFGYASSAKNSYLAFGAADSFDDFVSLGSIADNSFVKGLGHLSTIGGPGLSYANYLDYSIQTNGQGEDIGLYKGKVYTDTFFAGIGFLGVSGKVISGTYGIIDGFVQSAPEYTPNYGSRAGRAVNGWTAIGARDFDNQVQRVIDGTHIFLGPK